MIDVTVTMPGEICQISSLSDAALLLAIKNRTSNELASFDKYDRQILSSKHRLFSKFKFNYNAKFSLSLICTRLCSVFHFRRRKIIL